MRFRFVMAAAAAMLLSGCWWEGPAFYTGDPADAAPIRPGLYKVDALGDGKPGDKVRIIWSPNGSIRAVLLKARKDEKPSSMVMVRFAMPGRDLWITQISNDDDAEKTAAYGVAEMHGNLLWASSFIDCDKTEAIVRAAGGEVTGDGVVTVGDGAKPVAGARCRFKDRVSLERALRAYVATNPLQTRVRFKRIGD